MYATILTVLLVIGQGRVDERWEKWQEEAVVANTPSMWLGLTTGLNAAGNWSAGVPGTGIDSIWGPADGDATSDMTIAVAATLVTRPDYRGDIGGSGSPVVHGTSVFRYIIRHPGDFYWGGASGTLVAQMVIDKQHRADKICALSGTTTRLYVVQGRVELSSIHTFGSATIGTWLYIGGNQADLTIEEKASSEVLPLMIRMQSGNFINKRGFSDSAQTAQMDGGRWLQTGTFKNSMIIRISGGVLRYEPLTDPAGETPIFFVDGGILDVRESQFSIPALIEVGLHGTLLGNAIDKRAGYYDLDLNEEYP